LPTGGGEGFAATGGADLIIGGKLAIGRETGASAGVDVAAGVCVGIAVGEGVCVAVEIGVTSGVGVTLRVARRRERGPGLIGRTGSKYWV